MKNIFRSFAFAALVLFAGSGVFAQSRGVEEYDKAAKTGDAGASAQREKRWAVFIALDQYKYNKKWEWEDLKYPVQDAKDIKKILLEHYYIDEDCVRELYDKDATAEAVRNLFDELQKKTGINDSVFVFHAGHGIGGKGVETSAWIAYDGVGDLLLKNGWLPHIEIRNRLDSLRAKHVFLISDSCYSGALLQQTEQTRGGPSEVSVSGELLQPTRGGPAGIPMDYPAAYNSKSRQAITSGAHETVADKSEFASRLKRLLQSGTQTPYITPLFLCSQIIAIQSKEKLLTEPVLGPIPQSGHIVGGNFLFFRKTAAVAQQPLPQETIPSPVVTETRPGRPQYVNPYNDKLVLAAIEQNEADLKAALKGRANVNHPYYDMTALMEACNKNWLDGVKILLDQRVNHYYQNDSGMTALMIAVRIRDNYDIASLLIRKSNGSDKDLTDDKNKTALMYAIEKRNDDLVALLIDSRANIHKVDNYKQDALIIAASINYTYGAKLLLDDPRGVDLSQADINGKTAFRWACEYENLPLIRLFKEKGVDVLRTNNADGLPPLLWLIQHKKSPEVIEYLVKSTRAIESRDSNGRDVFWYLENYDKGNTKLRNLLNDAAKR